MYKLVGLFRSALNKIVPHKYFIPICLIIAFVVRIGWIYFVDAQPVSDFRWYYERGIDFAAGRGYSVGPEAYWPENIPPRVLLSSGETQNGRHPTAYWPVGYPALLGFLFAVFGPSLFIAKIANVILYLGILSFSYYIAKRLFASELVGRVTLLILSFYPDHIAYSSLLSSEILFLFLLLLGITLLIGPRYRLWLAFASGVVFGLACLVKPQIIFVPALFFIVSLIVHIKQKAVREYLARIVVVHVALGITILPWLIRNYNVFNTFVFISTNGGYNLLVGNNPHATGAYVFNDQIVSMLNDASTEPARDKKAQEAAIDYIVAHPLETIKLWPRKFWYLYGRDTKGVYWNEEGIRSTTGEVGKVFLRVVGALAQPYYVAIGIAFLLSMFILIHERKNKTETWPLPTLGLWIVLYFTFISLLTFGNSRFHFPVMPWVVMYIGALAEALIRPEPQTVLLASSATRRFKWS
jgi:4-amino-4-deoxy-L-arabinose transferase-like glycosyltransferase